MTITPDRREELAKIAVEAIDIEQIQALPVYDRPTAIQRCSRQIRDVTPEDPFILKAQHEELLFVMGSMRDELVRRNEAALRWRSRYTVRFTYS